METDPAEPLEPGRLRGRVRRLVFGSGLARRFPGTRLLLALVLFAALSAPAAGQELFGEIRTSMDGVYTAEQADGGERTFEAICSECHTRSDFTGQDFLALWTGRPLYALWEFVTTRMPYTAPGSLTAEQYAQMLAYILELNSYPAGKEPLPHVPMAVASIDMVMPPDR